MKLRKNRIVACAITILGILCVAGQAGARENMVTAHHKSALKTTATSGCNPGSLSTAIDLDINNVRAHLMTGGDMWWDIGKAVAAYEVPKGSGKSSQFAASCWIGGFDQQGQLKVAAQTYRQDGNDYWPGALDANGKITADVCSKWDYMWKIDRSVINDFISLSKFGGDISASKFDVIMQWPGAGNHKAASGSGTGATNNNIPLDAAPYANNTYAPFKDINGNGVYEPLLGEYPDITGDQFIWWVFNDAGNVKQQSGTAAMGVEVQTSAFAYATQNFLNNATFCNYRVINRGSLTIDSTYIAVWDDCDLGYYLDDFIGCDTTRGLGIQYNGTNDDGGGGGHPVNSYGANPPQVGLDFFEGPKRPAKSPFTGNDTLQQLGMTNFTYYNNDASIIGNPDNGVQIYFYMTGSIRNGQRFSDDFQGPGIPSKGYGSGPFSNFVFWGDPGNPTEWSECSCNNNPSDRRFIFSSGPFKLIPGAINDITFGCVWAKGVGGCPSTNFKTIKSIDDQAQALFDNHFKTIEGPEAPRMEFRELDRRIVFYLVNDYLSNNYGENYGRTDGTYKDSLQYHQPALKSKGSINPDDSLYKFQGYRVFQLANSQVTSAEIFDPTTGEVDPTKAAEVFQCDVRDGVKQIVNYTKNLSVSDTTNVAQVIVVGKDSGISHSFVLNYDQFATGADKRFVNYHNYYFVAIAYAFNNFARFDPNATDKTQDVPYLGSAHAAAGSTIKVLSVMPNPANGAMGTVLNADYGSGVAVTRMEGMGNGGNDVELDSSSEMYALQNNSVEKAVYELGKAPVGVKVVDPVKVPAYNWTLQIYGKDSTNGIVGYGTWKLTGRNSNGVQAEIYGEENLGTVNEQIVESYGLSIKVNQVKAPSVEQDKGNGYITSDISFEDSTKSWLFGVTDKSDSSFANWLRAGNNQNFKAVRSLYKNPCNFNDYSKLDTNNNFEYMLSNFSPTKSTWGPYVLASAWGNGYHFIGSTVCGFEVAYSPTTQKASYFKVIPDVDLVFTKDKSKWTRCAVIEQEDDSFLAQGRAPKFTMRRHAGWNAAPGNTPIYSDADSDVGMSWFPGYAIDQGTGKRLNIVFGEDSYLTGDNGGDMIFNPSSNLFSFYDGSILFGGKHVVYVLGTQYDSDRAFSANVRTGTTISLTNAYADAQWIGMPMVSPIVPFTSLDAGLIPTTTRLRFRVNRPYEPYHAVEDTSAATLPGVDPVTGTNPYYTFSTTKLAPSALSDGSDRNKLLSRITAVPNPYYGYSGYEANRFDTKVRIINLPAQATVYIYSLDGSLVRTLTKNDPSTSYVDWDIRNTAGLPVASGMYMMDVKAVGIGETVIKWFGATRPIDATSY